MNSAALTPVAQDEEKPPQSMLCIVTLAILRSASRKCTVAGIMSWMKDSFVYFRDNDASGWKV